jgi:dihydroorotase
MDILLKQVKVIDPASDHHRKVVDIRICKGVVTAIGQLKGKDNEQVIERKGMCISPGWIDLHVDFADPGEEDREDIESGISAAIAGGFTGAVVMPATYPPVDQKGGVEYVRNAAEHLPFHLYPAGAISRQLAGKELAEMYDMYKAGAVCFSDDQRLFTNTELLKLALQYIQNTGTPLFVLSQESSLVKAGQMHEGTVSTRMGLRGIPVVAEVMQIERDLQLLRYAGGHLHFMGISSAAGVECIAAAKKEGLQVTADVNIANLVRTDKALTGYNTNYKLFPPLRDESDRIALIGGVKSGVIDAVSSDHRPHVIEAKDCEFENALFGCIGLESCFGLLGTTGLSVEDRVNALGIMPRALLGMEPVIVAEGQTAVFSLFDPEIKWVFTKDQIQSKSHNTPFIGAEMVGRPLGVVVEDMVVIRE